MKAVALAVFLMVATAEPPRSMAQTDMAPATRSDADPGTAAAPAAAGNQTLARQSTWRASLNAGYRQDELEWSFALPGIDPRSELIWRDIESFQLAFGLQRRFFDRLRLKGALAYAFIFDGQNRDSDYNASNRNLEFSRSKNDSGDGDLWDISIALAYDVPLVTPRFFLSPLIGYAFSAQYLIITDGVQTLPPLGPFSGLDSSYDATWRGPFFGVELRYDSRDRRVSAAGYDVAFGIEYHLANFDAQADWNLRSDLAHPKSFEQNAEGDGWVLNGALGYVFDSHWGVNLTATYQRWETDTGTHRFFFSDGTTFAARLNPVTWQSLAVTLGVTFRF
jgi:hypothetical protein